MIQILGLREYISKKTGKEAKAERFFEKNWRLEKVEDIFNEEKIAEILTNVPQEEQYNLYFTAADCHEIPGRVLKEQWCIPFDVDDIGMIGDTDEEARSKSLAVAKAGAEILGVDVNDLGVIFSGHGVQFFIISTRPILVESYFDSARNHYAYLVEKIQEKLTELGLKGKVDGSVWSAARLMRFPNTENRKKNKPVRMSRIINAPRNKLDVDVVSLCGDAPIMVTQEHIADDELKIYPKPDTPAVVEGCEFIKHCRENQASISEPEWYAMQSVVARLDDGPALVHQYSSQHPDYSEYETDLKIEQAIKAAGPRTCNNINTLWGKCSTCKYNGKISSPIMIKGPDYVGTKDMGFRIRSITASGQVKVGPPEYQDLERQFGVEHTFLFTEDSGELFLFNGKFWEPSSELYIQTWFAKAMLNNYRMAEFKEFYGRLRAVNTRTSNWFQVSVRQKICFDNCVLDITTGESHPHSPTYGFLSSIDRTYDKDALCPTWDKFIEEICERDPVKMSIIEEFAGYALSGDSCWLEKCLVLIGHGANGKSVLLDTLAGVVGKGNYSSVNMTALSNEYYRMPLRSSLFNYSEESGFKALNDSDLFKAMVTGGEISARPPYGKPSFFYNKAKLMMAANEFPYTHDKTYGTYRRFLIVHLNVDFTKRADRDPHLREKLIAEGAGILTKLIEKYKQLRDRGHINYREEAEQIVAQMRDEDDIVIRFVKENYTVTGNQDDMVNNTDLYVKFETYCKEEGTKPTTMPVVGKRIRAFFKGTDSAVVKKGGASKRYTTGIKEGVE